MAAATHADGDGAPGRHKPQELIDTASRLVAVGKGLLASDESIGTIGKRIEKAGLVNTEVTCAVLPRQLLFSWRQGPKEDLMHRKTDAITERAFTLLK